MPSVISASVLNAGAPEKKEISQRKRNLERLERELADKELLLSTLKGELHIFSRRYTRVVGGKCAELDDIKAKVLELAHLLNPESAKLQSQAEFARRQARRSLFDVAEEAGQTASAPAEQEKFSPSDNIKKLFRETARKIHPDLTVDQHEREKRHNLMSQLNEAYDKMDIGKIQTILRQWEDGLKPEDDIPSGVQLARVLRQIVQVRKRLAQINDEIDVLKNSEMYQLKENMNSDRALSKMANEIDSQIDRLRSSMADLADKVSSF